ERPVVLRFERHQAAPAPFGRELVEGAEVRRLPAQRRPVINELDGRFARREVDLHTTSLVPSIHIPMTSAPPLNKGDKAPPFSLDGDGDGGETVSLAGLKGKKV